jgi:hypothetical protein
MMETTAEVEDVTPEDLRALAHDVETAGEALRQVGRCVVPEGADIEDLQMVIEDYRRLWPEVEARVGAGPRVLEFWARVVGM